MCMSRRVCALGIVLDWMEDRPSPPFGPEFDIQEEGEEEVREEDEEEEEEENEEEEADFSYQYWTLDICQLFYLIRAYDRGRLR